MDRDVTRRAATKNEEIVMANRFCRVVLEGMKKTAFSVAVSLAAVLGSAHAPTVVAQNQTVLKAAFYQPAGHPIVELAKESLTKIEKATDGRVKFSIHASSTLIPTAEMASGVDDGTAFMAIWYMPYMSKTIPLFDIETIPVWTAGTCKAIIDAYDAGLNDVYTEALKRQGLANVKVAGVSECLPRVLAARREVRTPADAKGLKVRSVGAEAEMFKFIGASPVNMTMDQAYEALSRGIVDGITNGFMMLYERSHLEPLKHVTNMNLTSVLMHVIYNPSMLAKVDPRDRQAVEKGMREVAEHVRAGLDKRNAETIASAGSKFGTRIYQPSESERKEWTAAAQASRKAFEAKAANDPLIKKGVTYVHQFNPKD